MDQSPVLSLAACLSCSHFGFSEFQTKFQAVDGAPGPTVCSHFGFSKFCLSLLVVGDSTRLSACFHFGFSEFQTKFQVMDG